VEVVRALVGAGAAVNQATVREDWGVRVLVLGCACVDCWCLDRSMRVQLCVYVCACVYVGCARRWRDALLMQSLESSRGR
jgi:hypothetical protein